MKRIGIMIALIASLAVGSMAGLGISRYRTTTAITTLTTAAVSDSTAATVFNSTNTTAPTSVSMANSESLPDLVATVQPAIVQVLVQSGRNSGAGSGFIIDGDGTIITNNHVIAGASRITVVLADNRTAQATVVGVAPQNDLAVLDIDLPNLTSVKLGDSSALRLGESVVAIGSALGLPGDPTVTTGIVSGLHRVEDEGSETRTTADDITLYDLIQTDAAINPGNSGGPLLNMAGEVIGVNTLGERMTDSGEPVQGINYAIPSATVAQVVLKIQANGTMSYPYLGINGMFLSPQTALSENVEYVVGQYVSSVMNNSPASQAGIRSGDVITAINNVSIDNESAFMSMLWTYNSGDTVTLTVQRGDQSLSFDVQLATRPSSFNQ